MKGKAATRNSHGGSLNPSARKRFLVRRFLISPFLLALVLLFSSGCSRIQFDNVPLDAVLRRPRTLHTQLLPNVAPGTDLHFGDYEGDGLDEVVDLLNHDKNENGLSLAQFRTHTFQAVRSVNTCGFWGFIGFVDADGDGGKEVVLSLLRHDSVMVVITPFKPREGARGICFFLGDPKSLYDGLQVNLMPSHCGILESFRNGRPAILQTLNTPWSQAPRHLCVVLLDDSSQFDIPMGGMPYSHCVLDVDRDGRKELLVGTYAPCNEAKANEMIDCYSWLVVISDSGRILSKQKMGFFTSKAFVSPSPILRPDQPPSVLIVRPTAGARRKEPDFVGRWSWPARNQFPKLSFPAGLVDRAPLFYKDPYTGKQHVVVLTNAGRLVDVDEDLRIVRSQKINFASRPAELSPWLAADLAGDLRPELVLVDGENSYFLSTDLRLLALARGTVCKQVFHVGKNQHPLVCCREPGKPPRFARLEWNPFYYGIRIAGILFVALVIAVPPLVVRSVRRKAAREQADRANAFRAWTLEAMDTGTVIFDAAGRLISINRKAREMLGLPVEAPGTLNGFAKQLRGTEVERVVELLRELDKSRRDRIEAELAIKRAGSNQLWLVTADRLRDEEGRVIGKAVALRDVTETVRSQQLLSWAMLARRLAHEVKTPIASVLLAAEKIRRLISDLPPEKRERSQTYFDVMFREIERTRDLAETMMQVADLERDKREAVDINSVVREALQLLSPQLDSGIEIQTTTADDLPPIEGSRAQISLAIANVLKNAVQAIEGEGKIRVRTFLAHGLQEPCDPDRTYVAVEIADSGQGIPEEVRNRIFDPYFSRKPSGTGLGLAIVKTVLEDHGGCIELESTPGVGTTFWLYFPAGPTNGDQGPKAQPAQG